MAIISWNKKYTETLAITLDRFREENPEYKDSKITYAGRLDPMAEGKMILLTGNDVHKKEEYLGLDKTYEIDFIFGPETDTYDILGKIRQSSGKIINHNDIEKGISEFENIVEQKYPPYSSKPVNGKPLWQWTREGKLEDIDIPSREVKIYNAKYYGSQLLEKNILESNIINAISKVEGDFRQKGIILSWKNYFKKHNDGYLVHTVRINASSGTYMRSLIHNLGKDLGVYSVCLKINRISIEGIDKLI